MKVFCKQNCGSLGGAIYEINEYYNYKILNNTYFIFDKNENILRIDRDSAEYPKYFCTEKELRKYKLIKIYENR
jgi:hypothetical protein